MVEKENNSGSVSLHDVSRKISGGCSERVHKGYTGHSTFLRLDSLKRKTRFLLLEFGYRRTFLYIWDYWFTKLVTRLVYRLVYEIGLPIGLRYWWGEVPELIEW